VVHVRKLLPGDIDQVVQRIGARLGDDAALQPLVNPEISLDELAGALHAATASTWIALDGDRLVGHLYGALLENDVYGPGVWIGPDGVSFDTDDVLAGLYAVAAQEWIDAGAREHYAWVLDHCSSTDAWYELGFARMHLRGVLELNRPRSRALPDGYRLSKGSVQDLDTCVKLATELDEAQARGPSFALDLPTASQRDELAETLEDPDVTLFIVEQGSQAVAQCITFALAPRRGSFDSTLHLSAVVVSEQHRGRGVATSMIDSALEEARAAGLEFAETNWRVTNHQASRFWTRYGFASTYVRLHRTIGAG
jgi:ribosomal protein S18 acetylase RimI-like enzyme